MGLKIRPAVAGDGDRISELRIQAEEVHARLMPDYFRVSPPMTGSPVAEAPSAILLVAETVGERGEGVVGYVSVMVVDTPREPSMTPRRRGYVETVVVDERKRGRGIGSALMREATEWARQRGAVEMVLTVWSENEAAEALYERLGYSPIARILRRII